MTEPQTEAGLVHDAQVALVSAIEKRTWEAAGGIMVPGGGPVNEAIRAFRRAIEAEAIDAFLASPQAAEELARALNPVPFDVLTGTSRSVENTFSHRQSGSSAAILAAWQKVREQEEASE